MLWSTIARMHPDAYMPDAVWEHNFRARLHESKDGDIQGWRIAEHRQLDYWKSKAELTPEQQSYLAATRWRVEVLEAHWKWRLLGEAGPFR